MSHIQSGYFIRLSQPLVGQDAVSSMFKEVPYHVSYLTHLSLAFFLWDIGKTMQTQTRRRIRGV